MGFTGGGNTPQRLINIAPIPKDYSLIQKTNLVRHTGVNGYSEYFYRKLLSSEYYKITNLISKSEFYMIIPET